MRNDPFYNIVRCPSPGLMFTDHPDYGQQMWTLAKLTKKHIHDKCAICGLDVGTHAYRPITNLGNRMLRICQLHEITP